jgi:conjugal transfer/entry exclusion protein
MKRKILALLVVTGLAVGTASAQFGLGGIVYDPTNYANALLRYQQLVQQLAQLRQTYQQIVNQYNLALLMARNLEDMPARYRALFSRWRNGFALDTYGNTAGWIAGINTGNLGGGYQEATTELSRYEPDYLASMDALELSRVESQYASVELADGANSTAIDTIGSIRDNALDLETQIGNLENDSLSGDPELNTEVSVLNKINASNVLTLRSVQDSNKLLASLLEVQTVLAKQQREATTNTINADILRRANLAANLAGFTGGLADSLQNFRMP